MLKIHVQCCIVWKQFGLQAGKDGSLQTPDKKFVDKSSLLKMEIYKFAVCRNKKPKVMRYELIFTNLDIKKTYFSNTFQPAVVVVVVVVVVV